MIGFGGPPAHVALLRELVVERRGWLAGARVRGRLRGLPAAARARPRRSSDLLRAPGRGHRRRVRGGLAFILPGLLLTLAIAAVALQDDPPDWVAASAPGRRRRSWPSSRRPGCARAQLELPRAARGSLYVLAGAAATVAIGPFVVLVLLACGLIELTLRRAGRRALHAWPLALPLAATGAAALPALAWTALKVGALSYGGGFVIVPLMQGDALDARLADQAEFANAVAYGQITPGPVTHTIALVGWRRARAGRRAARLRDRVRAVVRVRAARRRPFERLRGRPGPRAFLDGAGPAAVGAILGAAVLLAGALEEPWQWAVLAVAALLLALGRSPLLVLLGRRPGCAAALHLYDHLMADALQEETAEVLARLIRFNTVNPPGDERACQEWLRDYLTERRAGVRARRHRARAPEPRRARSRGEEPGPGARLPLARRHRARGRRGLDARPVVGRDPRRLPVGPRRARHEVPDRGRGRRRRAAGPRRLAPGARRAEGLLRRRRGDRRRSRAPSGCARTGPTSPAPTSCSTRAPARVMPFGDRRLHGVCCAEKGTFRFAVRARGRAGHASVPATADNALLKLAPAIERLGSRRPPYDVTDEPRAFLRAIGDDPDDPEGASSASATIEPRLAALFEPTLGVTVAPTIISAGEKINVIPAPRGAARRLPRPARHGRRGDDGAHPRRCSTASRTSRSSSSSRSSATARRSRRR